jgi:hypothetical protein
MPGNLGELAEGLEFGELGAVVGVGDRPRTEAVAERERNVVVAHQVADRLEMGVEEVLLMMRQTPSGQDRATARDDTGHPVGRQWHVGQTHAGMDSEVVDTLLRLFLESLEEDLDVEIGRHAIDLLERLVDGDGTDRDRRGTDNGLTGLMDLVAGREVHHRIAAPANRPFELLDLLLDAGGGGRVADVGVHLDAESLADDHRFEFGMVDVGRDNGPSTGDLRAHQLRFDLLAPGDVFHLLGHDALAGVAKLGGCGLAAAFFDPGFSHMIWLPEVGGIIWLRWTGDKV